MVTTISRSLILPLRYRGYGPRNPSSFIDDIDGHYYCDQRVDEALVPGAANLVDEIGRAEAAFKFGQDEQKK